MKILGLDPGSTNTGWCCLNVNRSEEGLDIQLVDFGKLVYPVRDMKGDISPHVKAFKSEIMRIKKKTGCTHLYAERFQTRGIKGKTIEAVSLMLGVLTQCSWEYYEFITAGTWKNAYNRQAGKKTALIETYAKTKAAGIEDHETDSCLISEFGASKILNVKPFLFGYDTERLLIDARTR